MSQELTPAQLERLKIQRAQNFKRMGLPENAGQIIDIPVENMPHQRVYEAPISQTIQEPTQYESPRQTSNIEVVNESNVAQAIQTQLAEERALRQASMYTAPRDKFNALESIRKGSKRQEFNAFIKAEYRGVNGNQLPEPKVGRRANIRPGQQQEKTANAIAPQTFSTSKGAESSELNTLEGLFTDKPSGISMRSSGSVMPSGNLIETDENYSNIGPSFDPVAHLRDKAAKKGINLDFSSKSNIIQESANHQIFQTESSSQLDKMMLMMEAMIKNQQTPFDIEKLKNEMRAVAKKTAEDTIKSVLKEYLESQKKKNVYEVVNKDQKVVKINNSYYQLKPVTLKG